ncbi:MAG: YceI family protein [Pseudomonadota bacterium]
MPARSFVFSLFLMGLALLLGACASVAAPQVSQDAKALRKGTYALDPAHASVLFKIDHLGFSTYVGRFEKMDATLEFDSKNPERAEVSALIDMTSLDIANEDFAETLMGADWFDAAQFPQARFTSTSIAVTGEATGVMTGDLTLKGETRPIRLMVTFNGGARDLLRSAYVVGFSARGTFDRTDFGVSRFSGLITDEVTIEIEAEFLRQ